MSAENETVATPAPKRRNLAPIIFGVAVLVAGGFGVRQWIWGQTHVETDNAQVEGSVVPALARVPGYVLEVAVKENQHVSAGDLLVRLDDREHRTRLAQAEADYAAALAQAGERGRTGLQEAQLAAARAQVAQAEANAGKARGDVQRYTGLAARGIISKQQLDAASAASEAADAGLLAARKQVLAAEAAVQGAGARLLAAKAAREQAALQLTYARIVAPVSGTVSRKNVELGQYLQPGQSTMAVVPTDDIHVVANLKETDIGGVRVGDDVRISVDAYKGKAVAGKVESLSPATGAKFSLLPPDNATGNYTHVVQRIPVRIKVTGALDAEHPLRPGMSVQVVVTTRAS
ncbi:MAG: HlyD family secretion protein [Candidatus Eisenbacteria bacterium]|nr:HlyD family secretion protein [Candidatus Eisenbacteria bacterium]